jgi:hypothetical protein
MWVEVGRYFARSWRGFFYRLENMHHLSRSNPFHLWLLHHLFLDEINQDCAEFIRTWNLKPISGKEGRNESPDEKHFRARIHGIYAREANDGDDWAVDDLVRYYGTEGEEKTRRADETGAGQLDDEEIDPLDESEVELDEDETAIDDEVWDDIAALDAGVAHQFLHKAVKTPRALDPFDGSESGVAAFDMLCQAAEQSGDLPDGYGILPHEWAEDHYPTAENLKSGRKGSKILRVPLPLNIWKPRAERWVQALYVLNHLIEQKLQLELPA